MGTNLYGFFFSKFTIYVFKTGSNFAFENSLNPQTFSKELRLAPKQILEIELPVETAQNLGLTFTADAPFSVSLVNDKGVVESKSTQDSPTARMMFRSLFTQNPVTKGIWKLKMGNTSDAEQVFLGFSWSAETAGAPDKTPVG